MTKTKLPPSADAAGNASRQPEVQKRFSRLRHFIANDRQRHRLLIGAGLLALISVTLLASFVETFTVLPFDLWTTRELQEHPLTGAMYTISIFGYTPWAEITVVVGVVIVSLLLGWRDGIYLLAITVMQGLINAAIKLLIGRPRPVSDLVDVVVPEHGASFPSGHVMFYTVFFGFLAFLAWSRLPRSLLRTLIVLLLIGLVLLIGPARIILGSHWLSDVIAAYLLGLIILVSAIESYFHLLAPPTPQHQHGLMRTYDK